jgi:beta-glucuronidase
MLYPRESETREIKDLSGIWRFKKDDSKGLEERWFSEPLKNTVPMYVPASYNDLTQDVSLRDLVGIVWYETNAFIPEHWRDLRFFIRVGSASHHCKLYINGTEVVRHHGGFLPFEAELTDMVLPGTSLRITMAVDNTLNWSTLPPGEVKINSASKKVQEYHHDFYNYAGIHRPVKLYTVPKVYFSDMDVESNVQNDVGSIQYRMKVQGEFQKILLRLLDENGVKVAESESAEGCITVPSPKLWQPGDAHLYTLEATLFDLANRKDIYRLPIGIRSIQISKNNFLINNKPFYFKGFGKHEDSVLRGKGLDEATLIKDFNLLKWIGANSIRTSHYPYSEEFMNLADQEGFVIIDEVPAVGFNFWKPNAIVFSEEKINSETRNLHEQTLMELYQRDKNHPSVVMWCVANEAATAEPGALSYFTPIIQTMRRIDPHRPVTLVMNVAPDEDTVGHLVDVICLNTYESWYLNSGQLETIKPNLEKNLQRWFDRYNRPVVVTEFGADAIAGFHQSPPVMFSEEYQAIMAVHYQCVFDKLDFVIGEHVWAFADFATKQALTRVNGNRKGVFTRERQPKMLAWELRKRWCSDLCGKKGTQSYSWQNPSHFLD